MLHNLTISHVQIIGCLIGSIIFVSLVLHALYIGILNITYISFNTIWSSAFKSINNFNEKAPMIVRKMHKCLYIFIPLMEMKNYNKNYPSQCVYRGNGINRLYKAYFDCLM